MIEIHEDKIKTPYNAAFVAELKRRVPAARWRNPYWTFPTDALGVVQALAEKYFPPEHKKRRYRVRFRELDDSPVLGGMPLVDYGRDSYRFRHSAIVQVIDDALQTGGSRRNPRISGEFEVIVKATQEQIQKMAEEWGEFMEYEDLDAQEIPPIREIAGLTFWVEENDAPRYLHLAPNNSKTFVDMLLAEAEKLEKLATAYRRRAEEMAGIAASEGV